MAEPHVEYNVSVEPTSEPYTLADLKDRLRVTTYDFDDELTDLLKTARKQVEHDTHRKLFAQTVQILMDEFPTTEVLELRLAGITSVTSVAYTDTAGDSQTFSSANYNTDLTSLPARLKVVDGTFWPAVDDIPNAVTITVVAGAATVAAIPVEAKLAVLEYCRMHWSGCDDAASMKKYNSLVNKLAWSGIWKAQ